MFNLTSVSLTEQRNTYTNKMLELIVNDTAKALKENTTSREIAVPALCKIIGNTLPNSGKGHADRVKDQVEAAIDQSLDMIEESPKESVKEDKK